MARNTNVTLDNDATEAVKADVSEGRPVPLRPLTAENAGGPDHGPLVCPLDELGRGDLATAGGKGANLGELIRAGMPVPPGFVVPTAAYDLFVAENGLAETIAAALQAGQGSGAIMRTSFERGQTPTAIERVVLDAYSALGQGAVAVRSSATAEDLPEAAFAGQQDSFLNVTGEEALLIAVRQCWESLWSDRAIAYRERQGTDMESVKLAAVVQRMVPAEAAGVMFTANPVSGARDQIVVDASPGLGEAVVSGLVTPDHYVLRKRAWLWRIAERRLGRREVIVRPRPEGGTEHVSASAGLEPSAAVPDRALRNLARLGSAIQHHFGCPQDIEWAWAGGKVFILQARSITALPQPVPRRTRVERLVRSMSAEIFPVRPYPLDVSAWDPAIFRAITPVFELLGFAIRPIDQFFVLDDSVVVRLSGQFPMLPTPALLAGPLRLARMVRRYDPTRWQEDPLLVEALAHAHRLQARDPASLEWDGLLATLHEALALPFALAGEPRCRYFPRAALAMGLLRLGLRPLGGNARFGALLSGVETKTIETNRALEDLAALIRSDTVLASIFSSHQPNELPGALAVLPEGQALSSRLESFLERYGHREASISTAAEPTWKDAPEVVLGVLKGLATAEPGRETEPPQWVVARDELLRHPLLQLPPARFAFLKVLLNRTT